MDNQVSFKESLTALGELFNTEITPSLAKLYWGALKEFTDQQVSSAIDQAVITCKYMPKPVEIRSLIQGDATEQAVSEWGKVLRHMRRAGRFGEDKLPIGVLDAINQIGGWEYLCTLNYKDLEFKGKDFNKVYEGQATRGIGHDTLRLT